MIYNEYILNDFLVSVKKEKAIEKNKRFIFKLNNLSYVSRISNMI